jgi:AraC-like DNA-binding protein
MWRDDVRDVAAESPPVESIRWLAPGGSVTEPALDSGYSSVGTYIAAFKQTFGCTPGTMVTESTT